MSKKSVIRKFRKELDEFRKTGKVAAVSEEDLDLDFSNLSKPLSKKDRERKLDQCLKKRAK